MEKRNKPGERTNSTIKTTRQSFKKAPEVMPIETIIVGASMLKKTDHDNNMHNKSHMYLKRTYWYQLLI